MQLWTIHNRQYMRNTGKASVFTLDTVFKTSLLQISRTNDSPAVPALLMGFFLFHGLDVLSHKVLSIFDNHTVVCVVYLLSSKAFDCPLSVD